MKKKMTLLLLLVTLSILIIGCKKRDETYTPDGPLTLTLLSVSDLHGYIEQNDQGSDGLSNMAYLIDGIRGESPKDDVVLIGNGDMFQGTSISNMTEGLSVVEAMNAMGFDAMGIGNHEFDWEIDTILKYFDRDDSNGEAMFPLLNANIYHASNHTLLGAGDDSIYESTIVEREGVEIGIISYIGDVYSSIAYDKVDDYYFDQEIVSSVDQIARGMKDSGVDVIVVNIHDGNYNLTSFPINRALAELQYEGDDYLVDAVFNGHTHKGQKGSIAHPNGIPMPVVQAGANGEYIGRVDLTIDQETFDVINASSNLIDVSTAGTNYNTEVETLIDQFKEQIGNQPLVLAGESITSRSQLYPWTGNVMIAATGADIAIHNNAGIRSTGGITKGEHVTVDQMYEISPFDNEILLIEATVDKIADLLYDSNVFYVTGENVDLNSSNTYTIAIISYVYYWDQLDDVRSERDRNSGLFIRDILIEDLNQKGLKNETFSPIRYPKATLGLQIKD